MDFGHASGVASTPNGRQFRETVSGHSPSSPSNLRFLFCVILIVLVLHIGAAPPSHSFDAVTSSLSDGVQHYKIESQFPSGAIDVLYRGEQDWLLYGTGQLIDWNRNEAADPAPTVRWRTIDGPSGGVSGRKLATATAGCPNDAAACTMTFDSEEPWNFTTGATPDEQYDFWGVATHEFGHWYGALHSEDRPISHSATPSMQESIPKGDDTNRTVTQDDLNSVLFAHNRSSNFLANRSYEYAAPWLGWEFYPAGGGAMARYNDASNAYHGSDFIQFNGQESHFFQEVVDRSGDSYIGGFFAKNGASKDLTVTVQIRDVSTNRITNNDCILQAGGAYRYCGATSMNAVQGDRVRIGVINRSGGNVSVDYADARAN